MNILLLNGDNVQTVCFARNLKALGHHVTILAEKVCTSGYASRFVDRRFLAPCMCCKAEFDSFFWDVIKVNRFDTIIPMGDESAEFLSWNKEKLEKEFGSKVAVPTYEVFEKANNKELLMQLCEQYQQPHPKTARLQASNLNSAIDYVGFPSMIKPNISAGAKGIVRVNNREELELSFSEIEQNFGACTLQQYVEQPDYYYNVMLYRDRNGNYPASTIIKIRRYFPLKGGSSCYCETIEHNALLDSCKIVLEKLNWVGFADFDVLQDINSGELKIIEINPRVPSSLQASFAAGVNFAEVMLNDLQGIDSPAYQYKIGQQVRWFGLDVMWFLFSPNRLKFSPSWFRFFGKNVSYHDGTWDDPLPMFTGILSGVLKYLDPTFRKSKLKG